jgi:hypothetical protein
MNWIKSSGVHSYPAVETVVLDLDLPTDVGRLSHDRVSGIGPCREKDSGHTAIGGFKAISIAAGIDLQATYKAVVLDRGPSGSGAGDGRPGWLLKLQVADDKLSRPSLGIGISDKLAVLVIFRKAKSGIPAQGKGVLATLRNGN